MSTDASRMMALFEGFAEAHGTHGTTTANVAKGNKLEIKKTARTVREPVTEEVWQQHLAGTRPLGVIPIRKDGTSMWGCIDVDKYDLDHASVVKELTRRKLPFVLCKSKSGGAHVFLLLRTAATAEELRAYLAQVAASMGWGDCEIFPKQTTVLLESGDLGNWLNMPYLGGDKTTRYCVKEGSGGMTVAEFLPYAEARRVKLSDLVGKMKKPEDETLDDGPPCLQHLSVVGFPEGTRNNGLFGLGVFCKKKYGEKWKEMLERYNQLYLRPPLSSEEVLGTIRNLEKKDYQYKCNDAPCVSYCNSILCRSRKYGVGGGDMYPVISGLSKLDAGEETLWFLDIEGERIELSTEQLQNYRDFQKVCMNQLTRYFLPMKAETWARTVGEAMKDALIIEPAPEVTQAGHFLELLEAFCMNRHKGKLKEDILLGKPWQDPDTMRHFFRMQDLMVFLERSGFREMGRSRVSERLKAIGGGHYFFNVGGKGVNVHWVEGSFSETPLVPLPKLKGEVI